VTATFSLNQYEVTATAGDGGSVTPAGQSISHGSSATLSGTPEAGYAIASVSGCNGTLSGNTFTTGPVTAACAVTATFRLREYEYITAHGKRASLPPAARSIMHGSSATLSVTPEPGSAIAPVSVYNATLTDNSSPSLPVALPFSVTATFSLNQYEVTATAGD